LEEPFNLAALFYKKIKVINTFAKIKKKISNLLEIFDTRVKDGERSVVSSGATILVNKTIEFIICIFNVVWVFPVCLQIKK